ncbi:hypothetical protein FACS189487_07260 [Campylobacterota bacterium]|nr:hypothetical protein FACS189487_07260 [Campylobacterota bacterium]
MAALFILCDICLIEYIFINALYRQNGGLAMRAIKLTREVKDEIERRLDLQ